MSGERVGAMIGAAFGLVFILVNAGGLPGGLALAVRVLGVAAFVAVVWLSVLRPRQGRPAQVPDRAAWRTYWSMVALEVVLLPTGSIILSRLGYPELGVAWVALVVGVHFLPFARAFRAPVFRPLAWTLISLGFVGGVLALTVQPSAGAIVAGVLSGVTLLVFSLRLRTRPDTAATPSV